jgi:hypothetical protein
MAQDRQSFALARWRRMVWAKQKPLRNESEGLLKAFVTAVTISFLLNQVF